MLGRAIFKEWASPLLIQEFFREPSEYRAARTELLQKFPKISHDDGENELLVAGVIQDAVRVRMRAAEKAETFWKVVCNVAMQWSSRREAPSRTLNQSTPSKVHSVRAWPKSPLLREYSSKRMIQSSPPKTYSFRDWAKGAIWSNQVLHFTKT